MNKDDVLLTDEDKIKAQHNFIKEWGATTGQILTFPLHGELREICLLSAQLKKLVELLDNYNLSEKEGSGYKLIPFYIWESIKEIAGVK